MRKSGLHKQISSIFDGVPVPQKDGSTPSEPATEQSQQLGDNAAPSQDAAQSEALQTPAQRSPSPSLTQRLASYEASDEPTPEPIAPAEPVASAEPVMPAGRPMPLSKNQTSLKQKSGVGLSVTSRKAAAQKSKMDPRQRKMTMLVGILSLVFGVVLFVSMGGLGGQQKANAATQTEEESQAQSAAKIKKATDWKVPEPLPETMRDPVKPAEKKPDLTSGGTENTTPGQFAVRGIVFSKSRPSAIVNDVIVTEGQSLNGATIVNIEKDSVEFEMDGNRWTQQVQR